MVGNVFWFSWVICYRESNYRKNFTTLMFASENLTIMSLWSIGKATLLYELFEYIIQWSITFDHLEFTEWVITWCFSGKDGSIFKAFMYVYALYIYYAFQWAWFPRRPSWLKKWNIWEMQKVSFDSTKIKGCTIVTITWNRDFCL